MFIWEESSLEEVLFKNKLFTDTIDMTLPIAGRTRRVEVLTKWRCSSSSCLSLQNQGAGKETRFLGWKNILGFSKGRETSASAVENWSWDIADNVLFCEQLEPWRRWQLTYLVQPGWGALTGPGGHKGQGWGQTQGQVAAHPAPRRPGPTRNLLSPPCHQCLNQHAANSWVLLVKVCTQGRREKSDLCGLGLCKRRL